MAERHGRLLLLADDLLLASRVEAAARAAGWPVELPRGADAFWTAIRSERPALVLVGMAATRLPWEALVADLKRDDALRTIPVLAFGPHQDAALRARARAAGCDRVVANSQVVTELPRLLRELGLAVASATERPTSQAAPQIGSE